MKLALIPPFAYLEEVTTTDYHLMLPLCLESSDYTRMYSTLRKRGDYLILDNGAAESTPLDPERLMSWANMIMPQEVVIPDAMGIHADTVRRVMEFEEYADPRFKYMAVLQGQTWEELEQCVNAYAWIDYVDVIGVPRHLITTIGDNEIRVAVVRMIQERWENRFQIHLLGTHPSYIQELARCGQLFNELGVRGVDTSAPFNYAWQEKMISHFDDVPRSSTYFTDSFAGVRYNLLRDNIESMVEWTK